MMTDKEIICHGVDVSECDGLNLNSAYGWDDEDLCTVTCCRNSPNCTYKQLKRKEQECEALKGIRNRNFLDAIEHRHRAKRYKQAIEKIERILQQDYVELSDISKVINEVLGDE